MYGDALDLIFSWNVRTKFLNPLEALLIRCGSNEGQILKLIHRSNLQIRIFCGLIPCQTQILKKI